MITLPELPYSIDALEPFIDSATMQLHHGKHHAGYITNLTTALADYPELQKLTAEELLSDVNALPEAIKTKVINNAGGHVNHTLFWESLTPTSTKAPMGQLSKDLEATFGSYTLFQDEMTQKGISIFGSGWVWLVLHDFKLQIMTTPNQNSPIIEGDIPLLGIDVWEHAYYLLYNNRRADYLGAIWNIINWEIVNDRYQKNTAKI